MTTRRHENLHFSRGFDPSPPNDGAKGEKSAYLSGNPTPSANCLCWRRGGGISKSCLRSALFWPSANGLAWREASVRAVLPRAKINPFEDGEAAADANEDVPL